MLGAIAITEIIREAKTNKGNLAALWLDLANTYVSIPYQLIELTMTRSKEILGDY